MDPVNVTTHLPTEAGVHSIINISINILYYALLPLQKLLYITYVALSAMLAPIWTLIGFLLLPITYLASLLAQAASIPLVVLGKLETLYTFFGTAILIGLFAGATLHLMSSTIFSVLKLDTATSPKPQPLRTVAKYRRDRDGKKGTVSPDQAALSGFESPLSSSSTPLSSSSRLSSLSRLRRPVGANRVPVKREMLTSTILEEDDTEESESGT